MVSERNNPSEQNTRSLLSLAIAAAKTGQRKQAHQLLQQVVAKDPSNQAAWLWLAGVTDQPDEALAALNHVERLNPDHPKLAAARGWAQAKATPPSEDAQDAGQLLSDPASSAGHTQTAEPGTITEAHAGLSPLVRSRRLWVSLGSLAAVLLTGGLVLVLWVQVGAAQARLSSLPILDNPQRVNALQPELNAAISQSRWEDAIAVLQVMQALDPANSVQQRQLAQAYYQLALFHRDQGDLEDAISALDEALDLVPDDPSIQKERRLMAAYHEGVSYHQAGDWEATIRSLALLHHEAPNYLSAAEILYSAYYNLGLAQQAAGDLIGAQASYQAAADLLPGEPIAREKADEVDLLLHPPTPVPTPTPTPTPEPGPQRIEVDVSEQRMYVYEGDKLRWEWVVSTGEPARPTAIGSFAIQSKIDMAYASTWNLDMPHWLGIYWSGPLENGIHALPVKRDTGYKLWDGFLGQRVSYGCVVLSDEDAETLYDWVEMGTPVTIRP